MSEPAEQVDELAFRRLIDRFSQAISDDERVRLVYIRLYRLCEKYKDASTIEVLSKLETDDVFGLTNLEGLQDIARDIGRKDLEREAKEFAKRKSKTKSKRLQESCSSDRLSTEDILLSQTLEVIIAQMTVFMRQVEILRETIGARTSQRAKVSRTMHEASQTAEKLAGTLGKAFRELETGGAESSESDTSPDTTPEGTLERREHTSREGPSRPAQEQNSPRPAQEQNPPRPIQEQHSPRPVQEQHSPRPSPKPRPKHKPSTREPASPLMLQRRKIHAQETEACVPTLESYKAAATQSPIAVRHGFPILPPPLSPKPTVKARLKLPQEDAKPRPTPPVKPKPGVKAGHNSTSSPKELPPQDNSAVDGGEVRDYELVLGAGDYTGGSTGDSGYGEAESWKQHMTNPPVDRKGTTGGVHYYKSLRMVGMDEEEDYAEVNPSFS